MAINETKTKESPRIVGDILGVFSLAIAFLLGIAYYGSSNSLGKLGKFLKQLGGGFYGSFAYGLPILLLVLSLLYFLERRREVSKIRLISLIITASFLAALFSIFTLSVSDLSLLVSERNGSSFAGFRLIAVLWSDGVASVSNESYEGLSGGLIGGLIGQPLNYIANATGAAVILCTMIIAVLIYAFSLSPSRLLSSLKTKYGEWASKRDVSKTNGTATDVKQHADSTDHQVEASAASENGLGRKGILLPAWMADNTEDLQMLDDNKLHIKEDDANKVSPADSVFTGDDKSADNAKYDFARPPADYVTPSGSYPMDAKGQPFLFPGSEPDTDTEKSSGTVIRPASLQKNENSVQEDLMLEREHWEDRSDAKTAELSDKPVSRRRKVKLKQEQIDLFTDYKAPPLDLLREDKALIKSSAEIHDISSQGQKLEATLESFGIEAKISNYTTGPTITRYELVPGPGVKVSRIVNLSDDIALNLAATSVRIEAPIPGKSAIGIEIPNRKTSPVLLRGLIEDKKYRETKGDLLTPLGRDAGGDVILCDIAKMPHILVAGATGSGKSVCINNILISLLYRYSPEDLRLLMIDPKIVELNIYNGIPHLLQPVVTDPEKAYGVLNWAVAEMERRYKLFAESTVRDIKSYNLLIEKQHNDLLESSAEDNENEAKKLPFIMIVIDELADLMATTSRQVESAISRLMAKARAAGIHVIIATQRPSVDVITGVIKANIPSRIAFAVTSHVDSRTILDAGGAEKLLGKGDMLYYPQSAAKPLRGQGAFVSDLEVERVLKYIKDYYPSDYDESVADALKNPDGPEPASVGGEEEDELLMPALRVLLENGYASVSLLQRKLTVGYPRAARLIDRLHELGHVGPFEGSKPRELLITPEQFSRLEEQQKEDKDE